MTQELLDYFDGDDLASSVWKGKYALDGEITPDDMHRRMAKEFARIEESYHDSEYEIYKERGEQLSEYGQKRTSWMDEDDIYELFKGFKYIVPQGSIMATLGSKIIASLSNCWVNESPYDSYAGILKSDAELAFYYKRRGGVGQDISNLRPSGTSTDNTAKTTTGAVSFMHRFSNTTREVAMNGRRGALMLSISINHPDVMDFIKIKRDGTSVTGANISIRLTDEFMRAVEKDEDYILRFPCESKLSVNKYDEWYPDWDNGELNFIPKDDCYVKVIKAKEYWNEIVKSARNYAEPGLMYWDNAIDYDPASVYDRYKPVCTNPCGEQYLNANDSCRLMALNLYSVVENPFTEVSKIDYDLLYKISYEHCRLGDGLVDLELEYIERIINKIKSDPEPDSIKRPELELWQKSHTNTKAGRRVGLGITALADMLAALNLKYDSDEALDIIDKVMSTKMKAELDCSIDLSILRGNFEGWDVNKENKLFPNLGANPQNKFYQSVRDNFLSQYKRMNQYGRRNVSWSTIAPTGSVSILTQTSSGCEPVFMPFYMRRKKINPSEKGVKVDFVDEIGDSWEEFPVLHSKFKDWIGQYGQGKPIVDLSKEELQQLFEKSPWYGSTANDIDWQRRNEIQSILQKYTTNAISSTINLPSTVTEKEVSDIYLNGWKLGLKGQTVYVDGSRSGVLVADKKEELVTFNEHHAPKRPKKLTAKIVRFNNNYEKWVAFVGLMDGKPYEVFTGRLEEVNVPGGLEDGEIVKVKSDNGKRYDFVYKEGAVENISNVFSHDLWNYGKLISGMLRHGMPLNFVVSTIQELNWQEEHINTWKNGVARALKKFIKDGKVEGAKCKDCGSTNLVFEEGCMSCKDCGSSKCG